jgi:hypothetical protein
MQIHSFNPVAFCFLYKAKDLSASLVLVETPENLQHSTRCIPSPRLMISEIIIKQHDNCYASLPLVLFYSSKIREQCEGLRCMLLHRRAYQNTRGNRRSGQRVYIYRLPIAAPSALVEERRTIENRYYPCG